MFSHNAASGAESKTTLSFMEFARWRRSLMSTLALFDSLDSGRLMSKCDLHTVTESVSYKNTIYDKIRNNFDVL